MKIFLFFITFFFFYIFFKLYKYKKGFKNKKIISFNKNNLYKWLNINKREIYNLSRKDSASYLNKRKVLLNQIRKEYKTITKGNQKNIG